MDMKLIRDQFRGDGIFSTLFDAAGNQVAVTLEHAYPDQGASPQTFSPIIPVGIYSCVRGTHQLAHGGPFETFEVTGVSGHTGILFHQGNTDADSRGCILLGREEAPFGSVLGVTDSRLTFSKFMAAQAGVDTFLLTVEEDAA